MLTVYKSCLSIIYFYYEMDIIILKFIFKFILCDRIKFGLRSNITDDL